MVGHMAALRIASSWCVSKDPRKLLLIGTLQFTKLRQIKECLGNDSHMEVEVRAYA